MDEDSKISQLLVNFLWEQYKVHRIISKKAYIEMVENAKQISLNKQYESNEKDEVITHLHRCIDEQKRSIEMLHKMLGNNNENVVCM